MPHIPNVTGNPPGCMTSITSGIPPGVIAHLTLEFALEQQHV